MDVKLFLLGTAREGSTRVKDKMTKPFGNSSLYEIYLKKMEELLGEGIFSGVGMAINKNDKTLWARSQNTSVPLIERSDESVKGLRARSEELHFLKDVEADYILWLN